MLKGAPKRTREGGRSHKDFQRSQKVRFPTGTEFRADPFHRTAYLKPSAAAGERYLPKSTTNRFPILTTLAGMNPDLFTANALFRSAKVSAKRYAEEMGCELFLI
jgi:hypothetical protein